MSQNIMEYYQEEVILAEANIVRAKRRERQAKMNFHGVGLDELLGDETEMVLAHEEKILAQETFIMKHRRLQEENVEQPETVANMEEFIQGLVSFFGLKEGEAVVFLDPKGEHVAPDEETCLASMLLNKLEEIEEQVAQMTVNSTKELVQKFSELRHFIVGNAEKINKD
jgi:hypothetical protein